MTKKASEFFKRLDKTFLKIKKKMHSFLGYSEVQLKKEIPNTFLNEIPVIPVRITDEL